MAIDKAREYLKKYGMQDRIREFSTSSATVELAAKAIGCEPQRIAKSISLKVGETPILVIASGDAKIDNRKYKERFGTKAKMLAFEEVEPLIGHAVGGICPFGINDGVKVYLDLSLKRFQTVFPACGSSNSVIEVTVDELENLSSAEGWVDVCVIRKESV